MKVIATAPGFYDSYRNVDDVFDVPKGTKGSWFVPVSKGAKGQQDDSDTPAEDDNPLA